MNVVIKALRIILVFPMVFRAAVGVAAVATLGFAAQVQAQSRYQLQMALDYNGRNFTVPMSSIGLGEREELTVEPLGGLRVYVRALPLSGTSDQALLDLQVFEPRGGVPTRIASLTMTAYLGTQNSAEVPLAKGKLVIGAYVQDAARAVTPAQPMGQSLPSPQPYGGASAYDTAPAPRRADPVPGPSSRSPEPVPSPDYSQPARPRSTAPAEAPTLQKKYYDPVLTPKPILITPPPPPK